METTIEERFVQILEQAAQFNDDFLDSEGPRAWDELVYPVLYSACALYSGAAAAMIRSAAEIMQDNSRRGGIAVRSAARLH